MVKPTFQTGQPTIRPCEAQKGSCRSSSSQALLPSRRRCSRRSLPQWVPSLRAAGSSACSKRCCPSHAQFTPASKWHTALSSSRVCSVSQCAAAVTCSRNADPSSRKIPAVIFGEDRRVWRELELVGNECTATKYHIAFTLPARFYLLLLGFTCFRDCVWLKCKVVPGSTGPDE